MNTIKHHLADDDPPKPLVLMLHGPTGTGKNFIASKLVESIFTSGRDSNFYHYYSSAVHFEDESKISEYREGMGLLLKLKMI